MQTIVPLRSLVALTAFATWTCACSSSGTGNTVPAVANVAPPASSLARFAKERVKIKEFADLPQYSGGYYPTALASLDGSLWVTDDIDQDFGENVVVRVATSGKGEQTYYYQGLSSEGASFYDIAGGPDGALWITDAYNRQILRLTTDGTYTGFPLSGYANPDSIVAGPDGALWFTINSSSGDEIGRITTKGRIATYSAGLSPGAEVLDIAAGSDGALWFTEYSGNRIGRITTHGKITEYSKGISPGCEPYSIAPGPDGALWFAELAGGRIGRIATTGKVTEYSRGITPTEEPNDLAAGPDGAIWFTEYESYASHQVRDSKIGRITMSGKITEYSKINPASGPTGIAQGPDGNMWFNASAVDRTGRAKP
jgi:virginiamycin B lyase